MIKILISPAKHIFKLTTMQLAIRAEVHQQKYTNLDANNGKQSSLISSKS